MIVFEAADTFTTIIRAAIAWVEALAAAGAFVLCVVAWSTLLVAPRVKTAARRVTGPSWRRGHARARIYARTRARRSQRRTAPWVHHQPRDYDEAA